MGATLRKLLTLPLVIISALCAPPQIASAQTKALLLFAGRDHDQFIGCLNCSAYATESICNEYGKYGSEYQLNSIWNEYGTYGSSYNALSPWNAYSTTPPVIVDVDGGFYGYFTANQYMAQRTHIDAINDLAEAGSDAGDLTEIRKLWCG